MMSLWILHKIFKIRNFLKDYVSICGQYCTYWWLLRFHILYDTDISRIFINETCRYLFKFHRSLLLRVLIYIDSALIQVIDWHRIGARPLPEPMMTNSNYYIPYGAARTKWVNSLRPSNAIWRHISGSTLAQVMACSLTAPSHYPNQCWLIICKV